MKNNFKYALIGIFSLLTVALVSCNQDDLPVSEIPADIENTSFLEGDWFLRTFIVKNGELNVSVEDTEGTVLKENDIINYTISSKNQATPFQLSFDKDNLTLTEKGILTLDYGITLSDIFTSYNGEDIFPIRPNEDGNANNRLRTPDFDDRLKEDYNEEYLSLFSKRPLKDAPITFNLIDSKTVRLIYNSLVTNEAGEEEVLSTTLDLKVIYSTDDSLTLSYKTSKLTSVFGRNIFEENFETGRDLVWAQPYFVAEQILKPSLVNEGAEVILELNRGTRIDETFVKGVGSFEIQSVQKDIDGNLTLRLNRNLTDFDPDDILKAFRYITESNDEIDIINAEFEDGDRSRLKLFAKRNTIETVKLSFTGSSFLKDGYNELLQATINDQGDLVPLEIKAKNFFEGSPFDFSNPLQYEEGQDATFKHWAPGLKPTPNVTKFEIVDLGEDKPIGSDKDALTLRFYDENPQTATIRAWGAPADIKIAPGDYKISFWAKSTKPIKFKIWFGVDKYWTVDPTPTRNAVVKGSTNDIDSFTTEWKEYEIVFKAGDPFTFRADGESIRFLLDFISDLSYDNVEAFFHDFKLVAIDSVNATATPAP